MTSWDEWLQRAKDWANQKKQAYQSGGQESESLGRELAARQQMQQGAFMPDTLPVQVQPSPSRMDLINPDYAPQPRMSPFGGNFGRDRISRFQGQQ